MKKSSVVIILAGLGFTAIVLALFAGQLGLTHSTSWGSRRVLLCAFGIVLIIGAYLFLNPQWENHWILERLRLAKTARSYLVAGICVLLTAVIYLWFSTTGLWIQWPDDSGSIYYDRLATSFLKGELALPIQPDPALLKLPDPYDPSARLNIPNLDKLVDMSLYKGKVYMYWGAVPALPLVILKLVIPGTIGDQFLVFGFSLGLLIFQSLLILHIWRRFFYSLPEWTLAVPLLFAGLAAPLLWNLSVPLVYETAIMADQFFFIGGLYFIITALDQPSFSTKRLALAGAFFSFAVGSRATTAIPVVFISLMAAWWIVFGKDRSLDLLHNSSDKPVIAVLPVYFAVKERLKSLLQSTFARGLLQTARPARTLAALVVPLMIGAILISWYNWARFESPFEFGFRYQIVKVNYHKDYDSIFLPRYIPPNLYMYLLNPPRVTTIFPFIRPIWNWPLRDTYHNNYSPHIYNAEKMVGLLYIAPLAALSLIPLVTLLVKRLWRGHGQERIPAQPTEQFLNWIVVGLFGCFLLMFASVLLYFYAAMRFSMDFFPILSLITAIGVWQGYQFFGSRPISRIFYSGFTMLLAAESIGMALLLPFASPIPHFQENNPELYNSLAHLLNLWIKSLHR